MPLDMSTKIEQLQLRQRHRVPAEPDRTLMFLAKQFKQQVEKPYRQMQGIGGLWAKLVPGELVVHTRLDGLSRGVLHVVVDSSARLYKLDRALRSGLQREIIGRHKGPAMRRIRLRVDPAAFAEAAPSHGPVQSGDD